VGALARDVQALTQQMGALRADVQQYRSDLRDVLNWLFAECPLLWGTTGFGRAAPRPRQQRRPATTCICQSASPSGIAGAGGVPEGIGSRIVGLGGR
jgi:hypothetical protein